MIEKNKQITKNFRNSDESNTVNVKNFWSNELSFSASCLVL